MDSTNNRRKSINLFLLILILLILIILIILIVYLQKNSDESSDKNENLTNTDQISLNLSVEENSLNSTYNNVVNYDDFEDINNISNSTTENVIDNNTTNQTAIPSANKLTLNGHTFTFNTSVEASIIQSGTTPELQIIYPDSNYKMIFNTDTSVTFDNLKTNTSIKSFLESKYNLSITSDVKSGTVSNLDIILFTISENNNPAYFIITPLSNSEIAYAKIYNTADITNLIPDLSDPLSEISSMISNLEN